MLSVHLYLHRMLKDAKKEKGQDDFLGYIVLKLKVISNLHHWLMTALL